MRNVQEFAREMLAVLKTGRNPVWFDRRTGLCHNYKSYLIAVHGYTPVTAHKRMARLQDIFQRDYGSRTSPFGGYQKYHDEVGANTLYQNPERMNFLRRMSEGLINTETVRYIANHGAKSANQG